ncbi:MAG: DNA alkylation repair protein, partial [Candidatus Promineifilaceae bacterium]
DWDRLDDRLDGNGFFDAGMQQQVRIMAETAVGMLPAGQDNFRMISTLAASKAEKIRGVTAFAVPAIYSGDWKAQIRELYVTGALEGTWPRELSATILHNLIIEYGVASIIPEVREWVFDPESAVRRLVAESFRPRGVMLAHITELKRDPSPLHDLLQPLLDDESDYVRKAVANNLNDISKDSPSVLLGWAQEWMTPAISEARLWIMNQALRTLVNEGNEEALSLLGFVSPSLVHVTWEEGPPSEVEINQLIPFEFSVANLYQDRAQVILILNMDQTGKGKNRRQSRYHLWRGTIAADVVKQVTKTIHFVDKSRQPKEQGVYRLMVSVNGHSIEERSFVFSR